MSYTKQSAVLAVAALLAISLAVGGVMAAQPTIDTDDTDADGTTSEWTDGYTEVGFEANESNSSTVQYTADSTNSSVYVTLNSSEDGAPADEKFYENTSAETIDSQNNTYAVDINHGELADVPMDAGENVTVDVTIVNDTAVDTPDETTIQVTLDNTDSRTVEYIDGGEDDLTVKNDSGTEIPVVGFTFGGADYTELTTTKNISGSATDVYVVFGNDTVAEDYSNVASEADNGDWMISMATWVGDTPEKVFKGSTDADSTDTYGVYQSDIGGQPGIQYNLGDEYDGETDVEITSFGNKQYGSSVTDLYNAFGLSDFLKAFSVDLP